MGVSGGVEGIVVMSQRAIADHFKRVAGRVGRGENGFVAVEFRCVSWSRRRVGMLDGEGDDCGAERPPWWSGA